MTLENDLGKDSIKQLVLRLAIPAMVAQFVNILYSIVDRIYVANIPVIGESALAALGVCTPIITLVGSFSALVGIGASPLMSIKLGEGDVQGAKKILSNALIMLTGISVALMVLVLLFKERLLFAFGASPEIYPYANEYFTIYMLGTLFALVGTGLNQFIMCQGYAKVAMKAVIIGAVTNIILDPIFIFALDLKVAGAAIATVIAQLFSCIYVLRFLSRKDIQVGLTFGSYSLRTMGQILKVGFNPFVIVATDNVILIAMNMALQTHGGANGDMLVACSAILQSFMLIVTMPLLGITTGTQPILGYNYGAKNSQRVLDTEKYTFILAVIYTALLFTLAQTIPHVFTRIFTANPTYLAVTSRAIRMYTLGLIPMAVQYTVVDGFTGIGAIRVSIALSLWRKGIFLACVLLIPRFFGIMNIFYVESIADWVGGLTCAAVFFSKMRPILRQRELA